MKFSHIADCHLGGWRDPRLTQAGIDSFEKAIDMSIEKGVEFILMSGDLFNTSLPSIDVLKQTTQILAKVRKNNIPIYIICGSHDFSPSGKTMIDVLSNAGLVKNVVSGKMNDENKIMLDFCEGPKCSICGMLGKKGMLEKGIYEQIDYASLEHKDGFKIFMFHSALSELKPKELAEMDSMPVSMLPKGFDYYAAGHVHYRYTKKVDGIGLVVYPGPTFPNNFKELKDLKSGSFAFYDNGDVTIEEINLYNVEVIEINADNKEPDAIETKLRESINKEFFNSIVLIKVTGVLKSGRVSDIRFRELIEKIYEKGAFCVLKNTSSLKSKEFEKINIDTDQTAEEIEQKLISEHLDEVNLDVSDKKKFVTDLFNTLATEKPEGMKVADYEEKIRRDFKEMI